MRRIHLIEIHDQAWFPQFLRNDVTETLQHGLNFSKAYAPVAPLLRSALNAAGNPPILDLCSGAGGPWFDLAQRLAPANGNLQVSLTDKYPHSADPASAAMMRNGGAIRFHPEPVDATNVPAELRGFRTMFTSFHHFPPGEAQSILQGAVDAGQGIAIFEITRRAPSAVLLVILWSLTPFLVALFARPFRWSRFVFTYLVPLIPAVLLFDGIVSCLRTYRPAELRQMTQRLGAANYHWEAGELRGRSSKVPITYLIGYPAPRTVPNTVRPQ